LQQLRAQALEMGAVFEQDWTPQSTHLVCAFENTPKYAQVKRALSALLGVDYGAMY
jgi:DNA-repair protein XRCC1